MASRPCVDLHHNRNPSWHRDCQSELLDGRGNSWIAPTVL